MLQRFLCFAWVGFMAIAVVLFPLFDLAVPPALAAPVKSPTTTVQGVIKLVRVEGGCYQLIAADGSKYELIGKFPKQNGLRVQVRGVLKPDMMTICQVGKPFQVLKVKVLKK